MELSHAATELVRGGEKAEDTWVDAALDPKKEALVEILQKADDLRLKILKQVLQILSPIESVHFLVAAAELHLRFHEWGKKRDERNSQTTEVAYFPLWSNYYGCKIIGSLFSGFVSVLLLESDDV